MSWDSEMPRQIGLGDEAIGSEAQAAEIANELSNFFAAFRSQVQRTFEVKD